MRLKNFFKKFKLFNFFFFLEKSFLLILSFDKNNFFKNIKNKYIQDDNNFFFSFFLFLNNIIYINYINKINKKVIGINTINIIIINKNYFNTFYSKSTLKEKNIFILSTDDLYFILNYIFLNIF